MINQNLIWSGQQIPFPALQIMITQPKMKELFMLEENDFFLISRLLIFSKDKITNKDKKSLEQKSNFEIIMSILNNSENIKNKTTLNMLLCLLFPEYKITIEDRMILLVNTKDKENPIKIIDESNFDSFSEIIKEIFCMNDIKSDRDFNPINDEARRIAEKIKRGRAVAAREKGQLQDEDISIFKHYSKILCMNGFTPEEVNSMTLYQLYELFNIFKNKISYEEWFELKLQGAKDLDDQEHWMKFI